MPNIVRNRYVAEREQLRRRGFTLTELLVVVVVIAILAALLLPALAMGKVLARCAVCKNNIHQMGVAFASYVGDFHAYPLYVSPITIKPPWKPSFAPVPAVGVGKWWFEELKPYAGDLRGWDGPRDCGYVPVGTPGYRAPNGQMRMVEPGSTYAPGLYVCPDYYGPVCYGEFSKSSLFNLNVDGDLHGAYGYNALGLSGYIGLPSTSVQRGQLGLGGSYPTGTIHPWPSTYFSVNPCVESSVLNPAEMRTVADATLMPLGLGPQRRAHGLAYTGLNIFGGFQVCCGYPEERPLGIKLEKQRHNGRFNSVYCDGNVDSLRRERFFDPRDERMLRLWNNDNQPHRELVLSGQVGLGALTPPE